MCPSPLRYYVPELHCEACEARVTRRLETVPEVTGVAVDLDNHEVVVLGEEVDDELARKAIMLAGYVVQPYAERPQG
jgi:copper chaperone CopZ